MFVLPSLGIIRFFTCHIVYLFPIYSSTGFLKSLLIYLSVESYFHSQLCHRSVKYFYLNKLKKWQILFVCDINEYFNWIVKILKIVITSKLFPEKHSLKMFLKCIYFKLFANRKSLQNVPVAFSYNNVVIDKSISSFIRQPQSRIILLQVFFIILLTKSMFMKIIHKIPFSISVKRVKIENWIRRCIYLNEGYLSFPSQ